MIGVRRDIVQHAMTSLDVEMLADRARNAGRVFDDDFKYFARSNGAENNGRRALPKPMGITSR